MSIQQYHWLFISTKILFLGAFVGIISFPLDIPIGKIIGCILVSIGSIAIAICFIHQIYCRIRYHCFVLKCPGCADIREATYTKNGILMSCSNCGALRIKLGNLFTGITVIRPGSEDDELISIPTDESGIDILRSSSPITVVALTIPVVISIIISSLIHQFSWFYLAIPGVFCFFVGLMVVSSLKNGYIQDNSGTSVRKHSPFKFWMTVLIWSLVYLFALAYPIGFALQESK